MQGPPSPQEPKVGSNPFQVSQINTFVLQMEAGTVPPGPHPSQYPGYVPGCSQVNQITVETNVSQDKCQTWLNCVLQGPAWNNNLAGQHTTTYMAGHGQVS